MMKVFYLQIFFTYYIWFLCFVIDCDTDQETDRLLGMQRNDDRGFYENNANKKSNNSREGKIVT